MINSDLATQSDSCEKADLLKNLDPNYDALLQLGLQLKARGYTFTTVTPATHARVNARARNLWARNLIDIFGWSRPFKQDVIEPELFDAMRKAKVLERRAVPSLATTAQPEVGWISRVRASTLHGQLFWHSAYPTTTADAIFFGPDTYRYASAIARYLASEVHVGRAVDIGCGSGPGAVVVALERPHAKVFAVDINDRALRYTEVNARLAGADGVLTQHSNLLNSVDGDFDLIVANPPYLLDAQERTYRHGGGSFGEGLSLAIVELANTRLAAGGTLLLYTGTAVINGNDRFLSLVEELFSQSALEWHYQELDPDVFGEELAEPAYADADRIAAVLLTVRKPQG